MRNLFSFLRFTLITSVLLVSCGGSNPAPDPTPDPDPTPTPTPYITDWNSAADSTTSTLLDRYWIEQYGVFDYNSAPRTTGLDFQYWPQAHAMDAIVDAYLRVKILNPTLANKYKSYFAKWFIGIKSKNNNGTYRNDYIDDMEWNVITMLRIFDATKEAKYFDTAKQIYDDWIITEWDNVNGGIKWHRYKTTRNACSNGPAAIAAAYLHNLSTVEADKAKYLADAKKIFDWERTTLFNATTGKINDNIDNGVMQTFALTYNQGTFVGAGHELYKITGTKSYLDAAIQAAIFGITDPSQLNGSLLRDEGDGDGGLFKGILIRYLTTLCNDETVALTNRKHFYKFIKYQADTAWSLGVIKKDSDASNILLFNKIWNAPSRGRNQLSMQTSGVTLIESMARLKVVE